MDVYEKLSNPLAMVVFVITLLFPIFVGLWAMRRTKSNEDYYVGGRGMGRFAVALSAVSSGRSSWLVLGLSGIAWKMGTSAIWAIVGYIAVEAIQFVTIGRRLRDQTAASQDITLLDWFESRLGDDSHAVRLVGALVIGVFLTAYVAAQFNGGAKTLTTALGIPLWASLGIAAGLILVYMVLGGYVAVVYNDVIRALIMIVGLVVLPAVGLVHLGGFGALISQLEPAHLDPLSLGLGALIGFVGIGLGSPGQPHIVVRYMSIDDPRQLTRAALIGTSWNVVLGLGAICIGLVGRVVVPEFSGLPEEDPEMIYLVLSAEYFGPVVYGLLVGGVFAAILSTADSQLLVVASTVVRDLYQQVIREGGRIEPRTELMLSRVVVVVAGLVAVVLAFLAKDLVFWLVLFAWGGLGASLGPPLILGLYWDRMSRAGAIGGMLTGTVVTILWKLWLKEPTGVYELIPAFFGSLLVVVVLSLLWPDPVRSPTPSAPSGSDLRGAGSPGG